MYNHFSPDAEESTSSPELDALISQERRRAASVASNTTVENNKPLPIKLNSRASMIISSSGRSPATSPPPSPRMRTLSLTPKVKQAQASATQPARLSPNGARRSSQGTGGESMTQESQGGDSGGETSSSPVPLETTDQESELRACFMQNLMAQQNREIQQLEEKAEKRRQFISDTLKGRVMNTQQKRSVLGLFDQSDESDVDGPAFCVTVPSTPCGTPPPERVLSERSTQTQITRMYDMMSKISTRITALETNIARINNERLAESQRRLDEEVASHNECAMCRLF